MERMFEDGYRMCVTENIGRSIKGWKLKERIAREEEIQLNLKKILEGEICGKVVSFFLVKMKFISQIVLYQTL